MARGLHDNELAAGDVAMDILAHFERRDDVFAALKDQGAGLSRWARSARLSDMKVTRANALAISGSVRQKLLVSSSPSSGRSGLPMIAGAMAARPTQVIVGEEVQELGNLRCA